MTTTEDVCTPTNEQYTGTVIRGQLADDITISGFGSVIEDRSSDSFLSVSYSLLNEGSQETDTRMQFE